MNAPDLKGFTGAALPDAGAVLGLFRRVRALTAALAAPLSDADASAQAMPEASPVKWHLAHTSWFFETFVLAGVGGYRPFDERFAYLFNSYYEACGPRLARDRRWVLTRPTLAEIMVWRAHVEAAVERLAGALPPERVALLELGCHHEMQHQELLLTDSLALMAMNPLEPALHPVARPQRSAVAGGWRTFEGGVVRVGHEGGGFGFDCEGPAHEVLLRPYRLCVSLVSNADWADFVADRGYDRASLWLADGWEWKCREGVTAPLYWRLEDGGWTSFGLDGRQPLDMAAPVSQLSFYEADAFATWADARLPTESEWEVAAKAEDAAAGVQLDAAGAVRPVGSASMFGDCWQWTASAFQPYPGFRPAAGAVGEYNGKFMSGQMVLKGASCATPRGSSRASVRNFFAPAARWQFAGLRLARDA
jgi:ergothioneine biosynthesis protein EgtB